MAAALVAVAVLAGCGPQVRGRGAEVEVRRVEATPQLPGVARPGWSVLRVGVLPEVTVSRTLAVVPGGEPVDATCVAIRSSEDFPQDVVECRPTAGGGPFIAATDPQRRGVVAWTGLPPGTDHVTLLAGPAKLWARPVDDTVVFPLLAAPPGRFTARAADGTALAEYGTEATPIPPAGLGVSPPPLVGDQAERLLATLTGTLRTCLEQRGVRFDLPPEADRRLAPAGVPVMASPAGDAEVESIWTGCSAEATRAYDELLARFR